MGTLPSSVAGSSSGRTHVGEGASPRGALRSSQPSPFAAPTHPPGRWSIVAGLSTISPAVAVPSISTTRVDPGPVTISSRWELPTRKKSNEPLCTPTDMRRLTRPPGVTSLPTVCRRLRIP